MDRTRMVTRINGINLYKIKSDIVRAFTHEIIGWTLSDSLVASHTVAALDMGISNVSHLGLEGLIHYSDRGI